MASEVQMRLAHDIASSGIWPYAKVIELMEKNSKLVEHFKAALQEIRNPAANVSPVGWVSESAYINARLAEEIEATNFARAFIFYLRRNTDVHKYIGDVAEKIDAKRKEKPEITVEWIKAQRERWLSERDEYMVNRLAVTLKNDPFAEVQ